MPDIYAECERTGGMVYCPIITDEQEWAAYLQWSAAYDAQKVQP